MLKLSFISKNTRETDNTLEKSTKILYDACIGSPGASLSCLRGYKSNMAPGTVKRAITESSSSLIDVIMVSHPDIIYENGVINTTISDHLPVSVRLNLKIPRPPPCYITVRSYANYDPVNFATDLASKAPELLTIFDEFDVNTKLSIFNKVFQSTLQDHAPIKTIKVRSRP